MQQGTDDAGAGPSSGAGETNVKRLQAKIRQYEKLMKNLEKERSELKTKVTLYETEKNELSRLMTQTAQDNKIKVNNLK